MKNDNRIFRKEQLTEEGKKVMNEAAESLRKKMYETESFEERMEKNENMVKVNGKWYDKRYMHK